VVEEKKRKKGKGKKLGKKKRGGRGDFAWVTKESFPTGESDNEFV